MLKSTELGGSRAEIKARLLGFKFAEILLSLTITLQICSFLKLLLSARFFLSFFFYYSVLPNVFYGETNVT